MTAPPITGWEPWAPPLDPPTVGAMPYDIALGIAEATLWPANPHLTAALQWEAFASTLTPTPSVTTVSTGVQSVAYSPAVALGPYGDALRQAQWHRSFLGDLVSVPLYTSSGGGDAELAYPDWVGPPGPAGKPGGSTLVFEYDFTPFIGMPPTTGQVMFDNADPTLATKLMIATDTASGRDAARYLSNLGPGDTVDIQDENDATAFVTYQITGPETTFPTYIEIPVSWLSGGGP